MTSFINQLNLRPQERRVIVVVMFLVFVVLNWWFVRPLFGQFGVAQGELEAARKKLARYEEEIAKAPKYKSIEEKLKVQGADILFEELQLQRMIDQHATATGVQVSRYAPGVRATPGHTNQFFEDQGLTIDFSAFSTNLVEFLVALASGNSMIRVQEMNLKPDGTKMKLNGNLLFVASYQKKAPARTALPSPTTPSASAPATNQPVKPKVLAAPLGKLTNSATRSTNINKAATQKK